MAISRKRDHPAVSDLPADVLSMVDRLVEVFDPERIYLFGSSARGDATFDSDYDFMVIVSDSDLPQYRRSQIAFRHLTDLHHAKDILVWTRDEFDKRLHLPASLPATIMREGILVYGD
jgi:predicted nucleotidyltransferase